MKRAGAFTARRPRRSAGTPWLLPLLLVAGILVLGLVGERRGLLAANPPVRSAHWIDPAGLAGEGWSSGVDTRWDAELRGALAALPPFQVGDEPAVAALGETVEALSFVAGVPRLEASRAGLVLEIELREPVAVVPVGESFLMVDADGVLLSGTWRVPTRWEGVPLPVIGPMSDADGLFARAHAGDWLVEPEHLDALDVAVSMRANLSSEERLALGRVVIDATHARDASVEEPGIRLELEGRRLILFGRAPSSDEPGELAVADKWRSVASALDALAAAPSAMDWDLVDVRWDQPDIVLRNPPSLAQAETVPSPRRHAPVASHRPAHGVRAAEPRPTEVSAEDRPRVR